MSKYLFVLADPPFTGQATEETLELAIGFAAIEASVSVLFLGAACLQLKQHLNPLLAGFSKKSVGIIASLSSYDIKHIYIIQEDLVKFKLTTVDINIDHIIIPKSALPGLYLDNDFILYSNSRK